MTLDEDLILSVDKVVKRLGTTRSAFTRKALKTALKEVRIRDLERKHRAGYARTPVKPGEMLCIGDPVLDPQIENEKFSHEAEPREEFLSELPASVRGLKR